MPRNRRATQRDFYPQTVETRSLGDIVINSGQASATSELDNGEQALFKLTTFSKKGQRIMSVANISLYKGSVASANQLPGGSTIDESKWQIIGPWDDEDATDGKDVVTYLYVRNISAGTQDVIFVANSRVITNRLDVSGT